MATLINVGSFTKSTNTSTPVSQSVAHGLGATPTAVIFWTAGQTSTGSFGAGYLAAIGFATASNSYSHAAGSVDAQDVSNTSQRIAAKAITILTGGESVLAECDLSSFDGTNINLSWTTNNNQGYVIHFIAIGGDINEAEVINWQAPSGTEQGVSGYGFAPDCLISCITAYTGAVPVSGAFVDFDIGVATKSGGQWGFGIRANDAEGASITARNSTAGMVLGPANPAFLVGQLRSFDSDGFTVYCSPTNSGSQVITLGLKGGTFASGLVRKTDDAATATQKIGGVPTTARGVLLASVCSTSSGAEAEARFAMGASDGTDEGCMILLDDNGVGTTAVDSISKTDKALAIANNNTPAIDSECDASLSDGDASLSWTTNQAAGTLFGYLIFGDAPSVGGGSGGEGPLIGGRLVL